MSRAEQKRIAELEVHNFNLQFSVGTPVRFWTGVREGEGRTGTTWTDARFMSDLTPIVYIRDDSGKNVGCVCLSHVAPVITAGTSVESEIEQSPKRTDVS